MISKVTEQNKASYEARIAQINAALEASGSSTRITSFESYFGNIREIQALATNFVGSAAGDSENGTPGKFLLMPLDEPLFEIDANKRTINIPVDFNKNGIGVRGDHMAETLYFKIDRYFDHQDLFNVDEIIINWQFRPANASRNADFPMHTSLAFAPDEEYIPGCVVFGWVIDNEMTPSKGTLSFSIGFVKKEDNRYQYALNTMIASVNVNDSLYLEDPSILAGMKRPVFERLTDSRYSEAGVTPIDDPVWRTGKADVDETGARVLRGLNDIANFNLNDDGSESEKLVLQAIGHVQAQDNAVVKYDWTGTSFATGEAVEGRPRESASVESDWVKTSDETPQPGITYYIRQEGDPISMLPLTETSVPTLTEAFGEDYADVPKYELGSSLDVLEGGSYMVTMQAIRTTSQSAGAAIESKSSSISSIACVIPHAAIPSVVLSATSAVAPDDAELGYEIVDEEEAAKHVFVASDAPGVTAKLSVDTEKYDIDKGIVAGSSFGAVAFKLAFGDEGAPTPEEIAAMEEADAAVEDPAEKNFQPCPESLEFNVPSTNASGEGDYCVYAINRRNHTYGISDPSNKINVSKIAPKLIGISLNAQETEGFDIELIRNNIKVPGASVEIDGNHLIRNFEVTVADSFDSIGSENDRPTLVLEAIEIDSNAYDRDGSIVFPQPRPDGTTDVISIGDSGRFSIDRDPGTYVIRATTTYHGTQRVTLTEPFFVTSRLNFD